nr:immunoglobulin heavy chain junction region [Mus musculus]MBK4184517.1 immunoglobulin heavy chain junction region [Mus musculus]
CSRHGSPYWYFDVW